MLLQVLRAKQIPPWESAVSLSTLFEHRKEKDLDANLKINIILTKRKE